MLSTREQEIAQLNTAGNTNPEIAATFYLSPRTVELHVGNILTKLGCRSCSRSPPPPDAFAALQPSSSWPPPAPTAPRNTAATNKNDLGP
jgi:DNA-binding NarL/FixJ family response regulator